MPLETTMEQRLRILIIPRWYPLEENPVHGIFVMEQSQAAAQFDEVVVLYVPVVQFAKRGQHGLTDTYEDGIRTVRVRYQRARIIPITWMRYYRCLWCGYRYLHKQGFKPDIIHAHVYKAGIPALVIGWVYRIPVIITEHYTGFARRVLSLRDRLLAKFTLNRAKLVLTVSEDLWQNIVQYGVRNEHRVIPNVVNTRLFHPMESRKSSTEGSTKRILCVALLTPKKGLPVLLRALADLAREDYHLDVVGDGPYRSEYEELTQELDLQNRVTFHGLQPKAEVARKMHGCDFYVLPSLFETFGVVLIEAMAAGKPMIASDIGGPNEIVHDQVGILVPPGDVKALAKAIKHMLDHYHDYSPQKLAHFAQERYSREAVGEKMHQVYQYVLEAR